VWAIARVCFALLALLVVVRSIQYDDLLVGGGKQFKIVKRSGDAFHVLDDTGRELTIRSSTTSYRYQPGAISLARNLKLGPAFYALVVFAAVPIFLAYRWKILLDALGITVPFRPAVRLTYAGLFLNFFLIGTTGGDLVKAYWLGKFDPRRTQAFVSVFVDRFLGLSVIILFAGLLVIIMWRDPQIASLIKPVGFLVLMLSAAVIVLFSSRLRRWIRFDRWSSKLPLSSVVAKIDQSLLTYRRDPRTVLQAIAVTVVLQLLASTSAYFLGMALQIEASIWYFFLYVPLAFLIGSIPISVFWGLGLLEAAYIALFVGSGLATATQAAMLAMAMRILQLIWALPGTYVLIRGLDRDSHHPTQQ